MARETDLQKAIRLGKAQLAKWRAQVKSLRARTMKRQAELAKLQQKGSSPTTTSNAIIEFIADFEGGQNSDGLFHPYRDEVGVWTIGYGHTAGDGPPIPRAGASPLTKTQALGLLHKDLDRQYTPPVVNAFKKYGLKWNQNQLDATVSFVYNVGIGMLEPSHDFGRHLKEKNLRAAADSLLLYDKGNGQTLPGLTRRRKDERALFLK